MKEWLFSYGTIQKEKVQLALFGRLLTGVKDTLRGYRLSTFENRDGFVVSTADQKYHLIAIHSNGKNDTIEGTVFEITELELVVTDKYEPSEYERVQVELLSGKKAWIYAAANKK